MHFSSLGQPLSSRRERPSVRPSGLHLRPSSTPFSRGGKRRALSTRANPLPLKITVAGSPPSRSLPTPPRSLVLSRLLFLRKNHPFHPHVARTLLLPLMGTLSRRGNLPCLLVPPSPSLSPSLVLVVSLHPARVPTRTPAWSVLATRASGVAIREGSAAPPGRTIAVVVGATRRAARKWGMFDYSPRDSVCQSVLG